MSKREKSELRDPEEGPKTPIKSTSNMLRSSNTPEKALNKRWNKYMQSKKKNWNFGSPEKKKSREEDIKSSQTKRIRLITMKNQEYEIY